MSKKYTLNRCRPVHEGEHDSTKTYLELSVVYDAATGDSYTSKIPVPAGTLLTNTTYWVKSSDFNAQLRDKGNYYDNVAAMKADSSLTEGMVAITKGYATSGDSKAAMYEIVQGVYLQSEQYEQIGTSDLYAHLLTYTNLNSHRAEYVYVNEEFPRIAPETTDSARVQRAIDSVKTSPKTLFFSARTWELGTVGVGFNFENVHIAGEPGTIFNYSGVDAAIWIQHLGGGVGSEGFIIENIKVQGGGAEGIRVGRSNTVAPAVGTIKDVKISGMGIGLNLICAEIDDYDHIECSENTVGMKIAYVNGGHTHCIITNSRFCDNVDEGVLIEQGIQFKFDHCQFEGNGKEGCYIHRTNAIVELYSITFEECWFERNNYNRVGTGFKQLHVHNEQTGAINFINIMGCYFITAGANNYHIGLNGDVNFIVLRNNQYIVNSTSSLMGITENSPLRQNIYCVGREDITYWTLHANTVWDVSSIKVAKSEPVDVTGTADTKLVGFFKHRAYVLSCTLVYVTATGEGLDAITCELGKRDDRDYFGTKLLSSNAPQWNVGNVTLLQKTIPENDVFTFYCPNGVGASSGKIACSIEYINY